MTDDLTPPIELEGLETAIGYRFVDQSLAVRALTHRSYAHEQTAAGSPEARRLHSEALEFVGDSVLGCAVAEHLFQMFPDASEGDLSRMKHQLVSAATLAQAAERIDLGGRLFVGRGEEKTGGRRKQALLADGFEALIAAIFFDGGYDAARSFILRNLGVEFGVITPKLAAAADFKTMLQEALQSRQLGVPRYRLVDTDGPPHHRSFQVEVSWEGGTARARGDSKKAAEIEAARAALEEFEADLAAQSEG
jgi:ribonuclease-3